MAGRLTNGAGTVSASTTSTDATPGGAVSYATMIDVSNPDEKLRPGMTAIVHFPH
jgi:hypothetical protein